MTDLPDVNVWLALTLEDHPHHLAAQQYWNDTRPRNLAFCRVTMLGYTRLLCNSHVMGGDPMTMIEAWQAYESLIARPLISFIHEPNTIDSTFKSIIALTPNLNSRMWTDAYLAAFAIESATRIVSFDSDFRNVISKSISNSYSLDCLNLI